MVKNFTIRKSEKLGLSFPYDWSNPDISGEALVLNVLERGIFNDICKMCAHYGIANVESMCVHLNADPLAVRSRQRMLDNIKKGFAHARGIIHDEVLCDPSSN